MRANTVDKIYCIRFVKLPPSQIAVDRPFDIVLSIADDVGTPLPAVDKLCLRLRCLQSDEPYADLDEFMICDQSGRSAITLDGVQGDFHSYKVLLKSRSSRSQPVRFRLAVSVDADNCVAGNRPDQQTKLFMDLVGSYCVVYLPSYEETVIVLGACTAPLVVAKKPTAAAKLEATEVLLKLPVGYTARRIRILEEPTLHIIGDHLWHCSLVFAHCILQGHLDEEIGHDRFVLELGAGCGLVSLAVSAKRQYKQLSSRRIATTDLPEVVDSTLKATLEANKALSAGIEPYSLVWGTHTLPFKLGKGTKLTVLASDVLYNSDSHEVFLDTLHFLKGQAEGHLKSVYIAYRHRVAGDEGFWQMASEAGIAFDLVYQLADIQLWRSRF